MRLEKNSNTANLPTNLKCCSWNIHGHNSRLFGNKLVDTDFLKAVRDTDLLGLTETHAHEGILGNLNIPGFERLAYINKKKKLKSHC